MQSKYTPTRNTISRFLFKFKRDHLLRTVFFLSLIVVADAAYAHQTGGGAPLPVLTGFVSDAVSKKPVKGVTIFVTSSGNRIEKSFITDDFGNFSIPGMPVGEVTIVLEKKGYKTYRKEKIVMKEGMQVKMKFDISNEKNTGENNLFHPLLRMMES